LTPRAQETTEKQDSFIKRNGDRTDRCFGSLTAQTTLWPTATATDSLVQRARPPEKMIRKDGRNVLRTPSLAETVLQPEGFPYTKQDLEKAKSGGQYRIAKAQWPTPRANPNSDRQTKPTPSQLKGEHGLNLAMVAVTHTWPTPQSSDYRERGNLSNPCIQRRMAKGKQINLSMMAHPATFRSGPQDQTITRHGEASPLTLNPPFVEWLMGWPIGSSNRGSQQKLSLRTQSKTLRSWCVGMVGVNNGERSVSPTQRSEARCYSHQRRNITQKLVIAGSGSSPRSA
jgi:hypothetical protein